MNTYKQINIIIGLLFVGLVGTFLYYMFDSGYSIAGLDFGNRQAVASARQEEDNAKRGGALFARYCRACHGITGTGALERTGLPGAPLNIDANRPPELAVSKLEARQLRLSDTIHCGRVGTRMPPWSIPEGGALNDFQILQLVTLITSKFSSEGWEVAVEHVNGPAPEGDAFKPAKFLTEDVGVGDTTLHVTAASALSKGDFLRVGADTIDEPYEIFKIVDFNTEDNTVEVARGPDVPWQADTPENGSIGSDAIEHKSGDQIYAGPQAPGNQITGDPASTADAPCGQAKAAPAAAPESVPLSVAATIELGDNFFKLDNKQNPEFTLTAGTAVSATLNNTGAALHDMRVDGIDKKYDSDDDILSDPDAIPGGTTATVAINLPAGTYNYKCDFHPDAMKGTIVVE